MKNIHVFLVITFFLTGISPAVYSQQKNEKLRRENSYFGIHFDLHVSENQDSIGYSLTEEMVDTFLRRVKPDFIQVDSKGHGGISSYPTEHGYQAKGYLKDPLKIFRKVTNEHNVALYAHFSGIYDRKVAVTHPEWAIVHRDGEVSRRILSTLSPYPDQFLVPQLLELGQEYQLDGAWVDGECWAIETDYSRKSLEGFEEISGISDYDGGPGDPHFYDFLEYNRMLFKDYMADYVNTMHEETEGFQITSNWAFSSLMPEPVSVDIDFLSGDLQATNSVYSAAYEARCLESQEMPWDLMSWSFSWDPEGIAQRASKSPVQLMQEAAEVISMGGGIQFYFRQNEDLSIQPWNISTMEKLAEFCRARQEFCYKAEPVPQAAVVLPSRDFLRKIDRIYASGWTEPAADRIKGCLDIVLDAQYPSEILMDFMLEDQIEDYPLIILPDVQFMEETALHAITNYVRRGGNLILAGPGAYKQFSELIPVKEAAGTQSPRRYLTDENSMIQLNSESGNVLPANDMLLSSGNFYHKNDFRYPSKNLSYSVSALGKGKIAAIYFDIGQMYFEGHNYVLRNFFNNLASELFKPIVKIEGSNYIHVTVNRKNGRNYINLINTAGKHHDKNIFAFDEIPATGILNIEVDLSEAPSDVILRPADESLEFEYSDGKLRFRIEKVEIHEVVEIVGSSI